MGLFTRKGRPEIIEYPAVAPKTIDGYDAEKADHPLGHVGLVTAYEDGSVPKENFVLGETKYHRLQRFAAKCRIEQRGIERVPNDERHDTALINVGSLWFSANLVVSSFAIGVVGPVIFQLGFIDSVLTILFINLLGIMPVCFFSTFGSVFGLRQMVLSRFYFGWYGVKLIALLNILACIGWSAVNVIVGAQLINAVNGSVPGYAGIIIIAACTLLITLFGYKIVHYYERWSWIPSFIVFLIVVGEFAHQGSFHETPLQVGAAEAGSVLSFAATVFGFATGWTSYAADYTCYQPVTASRVRVFMWTWLGLM